MLLLRVDRLPDEPMLWSYEFKVDGYRAIAFNRGGQIHLRSRNDMEFPRQYRGIVQGLAGLYAPVALGEILRSHALAPCEDTIVGVIRHWRGLPSRLTCPSAKQATRRGKAELYRRREVRR